MIVEDISNVAKLFNKLESLNEKKIEVGILGKSGSDILMIANSNEFGQTINVTEKMRNYFRKFGLELKKETTKIVIPERSFIRAGFDSNKMEIQDQGDKLIEKIIDTELGVDTAVKLFGEIAKGKIQEYAINLNSPKNSEITTKIKGSSNPLVDTGKMISSIDYEIKG